MSINPDLKNYIESGVLAALEEDLGGFPGKDLTAELIPEDKQASARLICRESAIICGIPWVNETFKQLNSNLQLNWLINEGEKVAPDQCLLEISGNARAILTGERTAMNFLQTLSGTATIASQYVEKLAGTQCQLLDTRKTIPGLRQAQKYAVNVGGGINHRAGLYDAYLIKENHIATAGGISHAIQRGRKLHPEVKLEVEVENLEELQEALEAGADVIMLDNFDIELMKQAVRLAANDKYSSQLEASGNITLDTIEAFGKTGVSFVSIGALTKHVRAIDLSLRVTLT